MSPEYAKSHCGSLSTGDDDSASLSNAKAGGITTHSMVMRGRSGTVRMVEAQHKSAKLKAIGPIGYV